MLKGKSAEFYVFRQQFEQLQLSEDDLLVIKRPSGPTNLGEMKLVMPVDLYDRAFDFAHNHPSAGHFGVNATLERLKKHMYWVCLLYTSPSPRDRQKSRMPSSA